jgi:hypothetical protein
MGTLKGVPHQPNFNESRTPCYGVSTSAVCASFDTESRDFFCEYRIVADLIYPDLPKVL